MKKRTIALIMSMVLAAAVLFIINKGAAKNNPPSSYKLLPRKHSLTYTAEWETVKNNVSVLQQKIESNSSDTRSMIALAAIYIQEGRTTENFSYYNAAAMKLVDNVLAIDANNFEALTFKSTILLSKHQFEEARKIAEQARQLYPQNAYVYGLIIDASVELGKYKDALEAADKMIAIRPDIRSYARIAYLREIHGDLPGAIEAMTLAIDAGMPGDEQTEWCRYQLGKLYEKTGNLKEAEMNYMITLKNRENYPYGLIGLAGLAVVQKNFDKALTLYMQADTLSNNHIVKEGIAEVYQQTGEEQKAKYMAQEVLAHVKELSVTGNEDLEMAHAYLGLEDYDEAMKYAMKEYARRPANIEVNEVIAIICYQKDDYENAFKYINTAMATNSKNPELLGYAGLIYFKAGKKVEAKKLLTEAIKKHPIIPTELFSDISKALIILE